MNLDEQNKKEFDSQVQIVKDKKNKNTIDKNSEHYEEWEEKIKDFEQKIAVSREQSSNNNNQQYTTLPGNHMDFSYPVAEEVDKHGNIAYYIFTDENGRTMKCPRRGRSDKALEQIGRISLDFHRSMIEEGTVADREIEFDESKYTMEKILKECNKKYKILKVVPRNEKTTNIVIEVGDGKKACLSLVRRKKNSS